MSAGWRKVWSSGGGYALPDRGWRISRPALLAEINEDLPYPGDGRVWETQLGNVVEVLTPPVEGRVLAKWSGGACNSYRVADLRERKPPKHEPHCPLIGVFTAAREGGPPCKCERREGEGQFVRSSSGRLYNRSTGGWWFNERGEDRRAER